MLRDAKIRRVSDGLTHLQLLLKNRSAARLFDLNVCSEEFVKDFLNCLYGLNLENLNQGGTNFPALDLGDSVKRIGFQVTTEFRSSKIQETLDTFANHGLQTKYDRVCVIVLGKKQGTYSAIKPGAITFDTRRDIVDIKDLVQEAARASDPTLTELVRILESAGFGGGATRESDEEAVTKIHHEFRRDALRHRWHQEGSIGRFSNALTELTELLGRGTVNNKRITIPVHQIADPVLRSDLTAVKDALSALRAIYNEHVNSHEIQEDQAFAFFKDPATARAMNAAKENVLTKVNLIGRRYKLGDIGMT